MAPPRPKRPGRARLVVKPDGGKPAKAELPFDSPEDTEVEEPAPPRPATARPPPPPPETQAPARRPAARPRNDVDVLVGEDPGVPEHGYSAASLYVEKGPGAGQLVPLRQGTLTIGRGTASDLRLLHPSISRRHAEVSREGERFFVRDLGSQNGSFLNRLRVSGRTELFPGDELALGNAVLRLRGLQGEGTVRTARASPPPLERGSGRVSRSLRVAVLVAAAASGLALVLLVAVVQMRTAARTHVPVEVATQEAAVAQMDAPAVAVGPVVQVRAAAPQEASAEVEAVEDGVEAAPAREPAPPSPAPPEVARVSPVPAAQKAPQPVPVVSAEAVVRREQQRAPPEPLPARQAATTAPRVTSGPKEASVPVASAAPQAAPAPAAAEEGSAAAADVLAAYEGGDVVRALVLARQGGHGALLEQLSRFQQAYDAGKRALAARNGPEAIRQFQAALRVDEGLSRGWGTYGPELHGKLAHLHLLSGLQHAQQGRRDAARRDFEAALEHDPGNERARSELAKLASAAPAPVATPKVAPEADRKAAIEDAWGDE